MRVFLYSVFFGIAIVLSVSSQADTTVYGKIHMSADVVDIGADDGGGVSSNASRIGFKGKNDLSYGLKAIWKIETEFDVSDDQTLLKGRNRYLGLNYGKSTLIAGNHDTPFKSLGAKVGIMINSIADRRGILGRNFVNDEVFDVRAKSSVMLINRSIKMVELRLLRSAGEMNTSVGDIMPITSASILIKTPYFMLGGAYEEREASRTSGMRLFTGFALGTTRLNAIYERLDSDNKNGKKGWNRSAAGFSFVYKQAATSIKAQAFFAQNIKNLSQSSGQLLAIGIYHQLDKPFEIYTVIAQIKNSALASYTLAGSGHGDRYRPSSAGVRMRAISFGGIYKF